MKKLIAFIMLLPLLAAAQFNPYVHNAFTTSSVPTAAAVYQNAALAVTNFNSFRFNVYGDSLSTTNNSPEGASDGVNGIWPSILVNSYGYNLITNAAWGGQGSANASVVQTLNASNFWPSATSRRTISIWWAGKNDYNGGTNAIVGISNAVVAMEQVAANQGSDLVLIDQPFTHTNTSVSGFVGVNIQRKMVNDWIDSQTNKGIPVLVMDNVLTVAMLSNSATAWNATYMIDGLHFTTAANTIIAGALAGLIGNSAINTNSMTVENSSVSPWFPSTLGNNTTIENPIIPLTPGGAATPTTFNIADVNGSLFGSTYPAFVTQVSYPGYGYGSTGYAPTMGVNFYSIRNNTYFQGDWGFRFNSAQGSYTNTTLFIDTSANTVGIGLPTTSNPSQPLEVNGNILTDGQFLGAMQPNVIQSKVALATVTVGASPFTFSNAIGARLEVYINDGTGTASVSKNGTSIYGSVSSQNQYVLMQTNTVITLTYSITTPTVTTNAW